MQTFKFYYLNNNNFETENTIYRLNQENVHNTIEGEETEVELIGKAKKILGEALAYLDYEEKNNLIKIMGFTATFANFWTGFSILFGGSVIIFKGWLGNAINAISGN